MADLNLDEGFFVDARLDYLAQLSGEVKWTAAGRLIFLWKRCIADTQPIRSEDTIDNIVGWFVPDRESYATYMVKARLAELVSDPSVTDPTQRMYKIKGVEERMQWLLDFRAKQVSKGKARIATAQRDAAGRIVKATIAQVDYTQQRPAGHQPDTSRTPAGTSRNQPEPASLSLSSSLSFSLEKKKEEEEKKEEYQAPPAPGSRKAPKVTNEKTPSKSEATWRAYEQAMLKRHGAAPKRDATINSLCCRIVDRVGAEMAPSLVEHFVNSPNAFYFGKRHDLKFAVNDLSTLQVEMGSGKRVSQQEAKTAELHDANAAAMRKYLEARHVARS